jgi:Zn-dependent protease with chaperone function
MIGAEVRRAADGATGCLARRERSHRRTTAIRLAALLVLGAVPVSVHHSVDRGGLPLLGDIEHLGALCLTALHLLLMPLHRFFHIVLIAGASYAVWDRFRAWRAHRRVLGSLAVRSPEVGDAFRRAAAAAGVRPHRIRIVAGLPNPAFTAGLLSPHIYLAAELPERLDAGELAAVIAHEGAHAARFDPLRFFLLRFLASTLFWVPALRRLVDDLRDEAEILADDRAARGGPLALASAILALAQWGGAERGVALHVGFRRDALLERRIRRLAGEDAPVATHVTRRSIVGAALVLGVSWACALVMAHPLPDGAHAVARHHCEHPHRSALAHLFCQGHERVVARDAECPHAG